MKFCWVLQLRRANTFKAQLISVVTLDSKARTNLLLSASIFDNLTGFTKEYLEFGFTEAGFALGNGGSNCDLGLGIPDCAFM